MALLVIDSKDNGFLKIILDLVKRFKGAEARLIDTDKSIDEVDDEFLVKEIQKGVESGFLSDKEAKEFLKELKDVI